MTYVGPKPALHTALNALAAELDPWHGHPSWVPVDGDDPWSDGAWHPPLAEYVSEPAEQRAERHAAAVQRFAAGLRKMAEAGDVDAIRIAEEMDTEERYAARNEAAGDKMHSRTPHYLPILNSAIARLEADASPPALGDTVAWCPTCKRRRVVEEVDPHASTYVGSHEVEWTATHLACGHTLQGPERIIGASPGGEAAAEALAGAATQRRLARAAAMQDD